MSSLEELADSAPVRKLLNMVLLLAVKDGATALQLEPRDGEWSLLINDQPQELVPVFNNNLYRGLIARLKIMAELNTETETTAQQGNIELQIANKPCHISVRTIPSPDGEHLELGFSYPGK